MAIGNYKLKVISIKQLTKTVYFFVLELLEPKTIEFLTGQFLQIKVGKDPSTSSGLAFWRPYSIFSTPSMREQIEILVDVAPGGVGSKYFANLKVADEVLGRGPFGNFIVQPGGEELIFIATGSGIAPIRSHVLDLVEKLDSREKALYFGLRYPSDVYLFDEFEKLTLKDPHFHFFGTVSRPDPKWKGLSGRVTVYLDRISTFFDKQYYLCGGPDVTRALKEYLLQKGVKEQAIHYEQY